MAFSVIKKSC